MSKPLPLLVLSALLLIVPNKSTAGELYADDGSLKGLASARVYFDVTAENARTLLLRLDLLERTGRQLRESGVDTSIVVGVRGAASRYLTVEDYYVLEDEIDPKLKIQQRIKALLDKGHRVEQCRIAAELHGIDPNDFLSGIQLIENGYVSLVGYQTLGYAVVPLD